MKYFIMKLTAAKPKSLQFKTRPSVTACSEEYIYLAEVKPNQNNKSAAKGKSKKTPLLLKKKI